jgi:DnaJ-class molecular chaperone
MITQACFEKDLYAALDIPCDASPDAVRRAYRKLARRHHPDTNAGCTLAERRFQKIGEAYAVLSDAAQRSEYDAMNVKLRRYSRPGPARRPHSSGPARSSDSQDPTSNDKNDKNDNVEEFLASWSLGWWAPIWQPTAWHVWWAPMWSARAWRP